MRNWLNHPITNAGTTIKINTILTVVSAFFIIITISWLTTPLHAVATGGQPGQFLAWGAGARSLGMGSAFFAVSDDASATYWNPAGMTKMARREVMALHVTLFADTSYDFISYVHPTPKKGVFGANLTRLSSTGFEKVAITYDPTKTDIIGIESQGTFNDVQTALTGAYGKKIRENISVGASGKYLSHALDTSTNGFLTFDLTTLVEGVNERLPDMQLAFGVHNILSTKFGDTDDKLPIILHAGASQALLRKKMLVAMDLTKGMQSSMEWHLGAEYWMLNFASLRLGFDGQQGIRETSAGLGLKYRDYSFDYAFALHDLGLSHRVSGSWRFGPDVTQNRDLMVKRLLDEAMEAYRQGNFLAAFKKLEGVLDIDPRHPEAKKMFARMQVVISYLQSAAGTGDEPASIRKGVGAYVEGEDKNAINAFRYAYYKNPKNAKLLALLNRLEKEQGLTQTEQYKEDVVGFTIIDQKVYAARQAIIEGKYDQALIRCQEILNLEPKNVTAMEMMGSAFYMMDQPDKARAVWTKVLEIDPTNKVIPEFINQLRQ